MVSVGAGDRSISLNYLQNFMVTSAINAGPLFARKQATIPF